LPSIDYGKIRLFGKANSFCSAGKGTMGMLEIKGKEVKREFKGNLPCAKKDAGVLPPITRKGKQNV